MTQININIPDEIHKKAKQKALDKDITLKKLVIDSLRKEVG